MSWVLAFYKLKYKSLKKLGEKATLDFKGQKFQLIRPLCNGRKNAQGAFDQLFLIVAKRWRGECLASLIALSDIFIV